MAGMMGAHKKHVDGVYAGRWRLPHRPPPRQPTDRQAHAMRVPRLASFSSRSLFRPLSGTYPVAAGDLWPAMSSAAEQALKKKFALLQKRKQVPMRRAGRRAKTAASEYSHDQRLSRPYSLPPVCNFFRIMSFDHASPAMLWCAGSGWRRQRRKWRRIVRCAVLTAVLKATLHVVD